MEERKEKVFADGLMYQMPRTGAPEFIKGSLSFNVAKFTKFLQDNERTSGWVNVDIKEAKSGNLYCELNTFVPTKPASMSESEETESNIPF